MALGFILGCLAGYFVVAAIIIGIKYYFFSNKIDTDIALEHRDYPSTRMVSVSSDREMSRIFRRKKPADIHDPSRN